MTIMLRYATLLHQAAAEGDVDAWNSAIDVYDELRITDDAEDAEVAVQCTFWRSKG